MGAAHPFVSVRGSAQSGSGDRLYYAGGDGDYRHAPAADPGRHNGLSEGRGDAARAARASDAYRTGPASSLLPSKGSAYAGGILLGAGDHLRDSRSFFVLDAANPDRTVSRHRVRSAKRSALQAREDGTDRK